MRTPVQSHASEMKSVAALLWILAVLCTAPGDAKKQKKLEIKTEVICKECVKSVHQIFATPLFFFQCF